MKITLTRRIWFTVASIVLFFTLLLLYIVPTQQQKYFTSNFNKEVQNLANTVALGVEIALTEQNFEGVQTAMDFVKNDTRLEFVAIVQSDTVWDENYRNYTLRQNVIEVYPDTVEIDPGVESSENLIVKRAAFQSSVFNGNIITGFNTAEIRKNMMEIRLVAVVVSFIVFVFGILLGLWLARTISIPVLRIRDAALKVGAGDLSQRVETRSKDEIGELTQVFNKMVVGLATAEERLTQKNNELENTLLHLEEKNVAIEKERRRSDELLRNILPEETAEELKKFGKSQPKNFDMVTVMFVDFSHFTLIAEHLTPSRLVAEIDLLFRAFDRIIGNYPIEKIKTIGDAYLCASGLPSPNQTHAFHIVRAALEIQRYLHEYQDSRRKEKLPFFEARIGIHSGPVVAGIVGSKKFAYDIWGDTVNTAARMEQSGEAGKINISGTTYGLVKDCFKVKSRGKVEAKHKGQVEMYFVLEEIILVQDQKS
ncbi:MAG: adenylate/guanylate cyclase domain-containing protein [Bacteroidia bacterium]